MDNKPKIYVTEAGYNQYIQALKESEAILSEKLRERTGNGRNRVGSDGDYQTSVSDNEVALAANTVSRIKEEIMRLEVVSKENLSETQIDLEDIVTLLHNDTNEVRQVKLTGGMPVVGFGTEVHSITINSPMGKAIYKKNVGDTVSYSVGKNNFSVSILSKEKEFTMPENEREPE